MNYMHPFRVFVSYANEDKELAEKLINTLKKLKLEPLWDKNIRVGTPFTASIKELITRAHIFMPLITDKAQKRPWVHQETGYAMALNIPILPIAVEDTPPGEMISQLQTIMVKSKLENLEERLRKVNFEQLVSPRPVEPQPIVKVASWPEERTKLLAQYSNHVIRLGKYGRVRQRGAFSSFCIPDKNLDDPIWKLREGNLQRSEYYHNLQREERQALEKHASENGCSLIIDPTMSFKDLGPTVAPARLSTLLAFIKSMPKDKIQIVIWKKAREDNLTIVGDWFVADSQVPRRGGYRQTIFNWHAPTVFNWIRKFNQEFEELYKKSELGPNESRDIAIAEIEKIIHSSPGFEEYKDSLTKVLRKKH